MTKEEYDECIGKLNSGSPYEQLQASMLLKLLPTYESKTPASKGFSVFQDEIVKDKLEKLVDE